MRENKAGAVRVLRASGLGAGATGAGCFVGGYRESGYVSTKEDREARSWTW